MRLIIPKWEGEKTFSLECSIDNLNSFLSLPELSRLNDLDDHCTSKLGIPPAPKAVNGGGRCVPTHSHKGDTGVKVEGDM